MAVFAYRVARPDGSTMDGYLEGDDESGPCKIRIPRVTGF